MVIHNKKTVKGLYCLIILLVFIVVSYNRCSLPWYVLDIGYHEIIQSHYNCKQNIVIIDTGVCDKAYNDGNIVCSYNAVNESYEVTEDFEGHGTAMYSIITGFADAKISGLAYRDDIYIVKAVDDNGIMKLEYLYNGLTFAQDNEADVVCVSYGGYKGSNQIDKLLKNMYEEGITVVAAAGNDVEDFVMYPASSEYVISVGYYGKDYRIGALSSRGDKVDCLFPGEKIRHASLDGKTIESTGTSEANAIAVSYIARIRGEYLYKNHREMNNSEVRNAIKGLNTLEMSNMNYIKPFEEIVGGANE